MPRPVEQAIALLSAARHMVALTGAGISTPSGIPDFRGRSSGLWTEADPLAVASIWAFHDRPEQFYRWIRPVMVKMLAARPNVAHTTLALLEQHGLSESRYHPEHRLTPFEGRQPARAGNTRPYPHRELSGMSPRRHIRSLSGQPCWTAFRRRPVPHAAVS